MSPNYPPRSRALLEHLQERFLVADGAMGTLLYQRGVPLESNFEHLNLIRPELIAAVHRDYVAAGAMLLETNTFGANAPRLGAIGLAHRVEAINLAGARLARQQAGERFVAGAVGPLPQPRGTDGELDAEAKRVAFHQQMQALAEGGVDAFVLETFSSLTDLELALAVARELGLPAIAQLAFLDKGHARDGSDAASLAARLEAAGAAVIGANCGSGPRELLAVIRQLASLTARPLSAFPNSGFPQLHEGRYIYLATPEYFAAMGRELALAGATLIGGCCGTTPEHIQALSGALESLTPARRAPVCTSSPAPAEPQRITATPRSRGFLAAWGERPVVTVELDPPRGLDCAKVLAAAKRLRAAGADAISLAENPLARVRMGNIALARRIQEETGMEVIVHITCRDRNLIGLHSELMGAHLLGIRAVLAVTGDPVSLGDGAGATSVFDLHSVGLLELLHSLNQGRSLFGVDLGGRTDFLLGAAYSPNVANLAAETRRLEKKISAGARFVQTQPIYDSARLEELLDHTAPLEIPVLVGILPLVSERNAEFLHNEVPGIRLPEAVRARMRGKQGEQGVAEGLAIAGELIAAGRGRVGGWYLMPPFGKVDLAERLLEEIRR